MKIKKTILFIVALPKVKHLGINLIQGLMDLYTENYKMLMKEIEENTNKQEDIFACGLKDNIVKMSVQPKLIDLMQTK